MNVIPCDTAYSLYPRATFEERTSLICQPLSGAQANKTHPKWLKEGWDLRQDHDEEDKKFILGTQRWIGDKHS